MSCPAASIQKNALNYGNFQLWQLEHSCFPFTVNGNFSSWSDWTQCLQVENGIWAQTRFRGCNNPPPSNGGLNCFGQFEDYSTQNCLPGVTPNFTWKLHCFLDTLSHFEDILKCCLVAWISFLLMHWTTTISWFNFPVDGYWALWSTWSPCPPCGYQSMERYRMCSVPILGGLNCTGSWSESAMCPIPPCPGMKKLCN